jgi:hypothetical protein
MQNRVDGRDKPGQDGGDGSKVCLRVKTHGGACNVVSRASGSIPQPRKNST